MKQENALSRRLKSGLLSISRSITWYMDDIPSMTESEACAQKVWLKVKSNLPIQWRATNEKRAPWTAVSVVEGTGNNFSTPQGVPYIEVPLLRLPLAVILPSLEIPLSRKGDRMLSWVSPVRSCPAHSSLSNHARTFKKSNHIHEKEIQGNTAHCK